MKAFAVAALLACCAPSILAQRNQSPIKPTGTPRIRRPLVLHQTRYQLRAGERSKISAPSETLDFMIAAKNRTVRIGGRDAKGFVIGPATSGNELLLAASLAAEPGEYELEVSAVNEAGEERVSTVDVILDPLHAVPSTATKPPVILLNGWQSVGCPPATGPSDTFGRALVPELQFDGVPLVYFFDNCVECPNCLIEDIGNALGRTLNLIRYDTGALVPQVDLVGHSMGGLITRTYLTGLQSNGSLLPPANPRVRKLILIATPHFGSFLAASPLVPLLWGRQTQELIPGNALLWNLATWNQRGDDLRGVDALAVIGNAGPSNANDGVVSLTSASIGFARDPSRTRILPYCHTPSLFVDCTGPSIANVDEAWQTDQIIRSFLADTPDWRSIGKTPIIDPFLSQYGGIYFAYQTAGAQWVTDLTQAAFGNVPLEAGYASGTFFYHEFIKGTDTFRFTSRLLGAFTCGPFTQPAGYYSAVRCKSSPVIFSVRPLLQNATGLIVRSDTTITINGSGFGQVCASCGIFAAPTGSSVGYGLQVSSWSDQAISAYLPATYSGLVQVIVQTASGRDAINIMAAALPATPPPVVAVAPSSLQFAYTIGGAVPAGQSIRLTNSGGGTLTWTASSSAPWLSVTPVSGTAPSTLTITVAPVGLAARTYTGTITISAAGIASQIVVINLAVNAPAAPAPMLSNVVNAASFRPGMVVGGLATVFGKNLSPIKGIELPGGATSYKGVTVRVQGRAVPLLGVANVNGQEQINFQVPFDFGVPSTARVEVNNNGSSSALDNVPVLRAQPGIFEYTPRGSNTRYAAMLKVDGSVVGPNNPVSRGDAASIFLTGMGVTLPILQTGQLGPTDPPAVTFLQPVVGIAGVGAQVLFSGYAPGFLGLYQINIVVPPDAPTGAVVNLDIVVAGAASQTSHIAVQ